jgi:Carbohydrate binding domain
VTLARVQNPNRPIAGWQINPQNGANTTYPATGWYDITSRVVAWSSGFGKQRELGLAEAGTCTATCRDVDEYLNPGNSSSPYNTGGNTLALYRPIRHWEMWPFTGNMLNSTNSTWGTLLIGGSSSMADTASFEGGTVGQWKISTVGSTTTLANSAVRAHDGTKSLLLTWPTQTSPGPAGTASVTAPAPPMRSGDTYTASAWVWLVSGPAVTLSCNGSTASSTSTTGVWQRVVLTFTATDATSDSIILYASGNTTSGQQVFVDSVQVEWASSASTFTTSGPTVYPIFTGYIERYPTTWKHMGFEGFCELGCVDALGMIPRIQLASVMEEEIKLNSPSFWWGLDDNPALAAGLIHPWNQKGSVKDPSIRSWHSNWAWVGSNPSSSNSSLSGSGVIKGPGPDAPACILLQPYWNATAPPAAPDLGACLFNYWNTGLVGGTAAGFTVEFWFCSNNSNLVPTWASRLFTIHGITGGNLQDEYEFNLSSTGALRYDYYSGGTSVGTINAPGTNYYDNVWHHIVLMSTASGGTITDQVYYDGTSAGTITHSGSVVPDRRGAGFGTNRWTTPATYNAWNVIASIGGSGSPYFQGAFSNLMIYQSGSALKSSDINSHYYIGYNGFSGSTVTDWILRILLYAGWQGYTNIVGGQGSALGQTRGMGGGSVSDALKYAADTDQGLLYANPYGQLAYITQATIAASTPTLTFGENFSGGEVPYDEGAQCELEPSQVFNDITVQPHGLSNSTGDTYLSAVEVTDATSVAAYGTRTMSVDVWPQDGSAGLAQLNSLAAFLLAQRKDPHLMVTGVVIRPSTNPALWSIVLALTLLQCVTWKRRTPAFTQSVNGYIQNFAWTETPEEGMVLTVSIEPQQV